MLSEEHEMAPAWMTRTLRLAAIYNLAWGAAVIVAPLLLFRWAGMEEPRYPQIWQCVGMIVGVYGVGYWFAANDPHRHWPIVLVGFLGKILGPIGFLQAAIAGDLPWAWGATIITNDIVWWLPFGIMLYSAFRTNTDTSRGIETRDFESITNVFRGSRDATLAELSSTSPTMVVFLRHTGCTFCRETLAELQRYRRDIESNGVTLAIVHMGYPMDGTLMLQKYNLEGVHHFSDPNCIMYRAFGLQRGKFSQLFGFSVFKRGIEAAFRGHGMGRLKGDGFRMPGVFLLAHGKIVEAHRPETAADTHDYVKLASRAAGLWKILNQTSEQNLDRVPKSIESQSTSQDAIVSG